jgi:outer membrane protein OmpA-like peptidoglycan-associated protein
VKKQKPTGVVEEKGEHAPIWIISFADMISLLMAFFVMLLTMSTARSGKLCNEGEGIFEKTLYGFRSTISGLGMPELFGGKAEMPGGPESSLNLDSRKTYHPISGGDADAGRTIDASEEKVRRIFNQLKGQTKTLRSPISGRRPEFVIVPVMFGRGQFVLDEANRQFLGRFAANIQESAGAKRPTLYVVGFAAQEPGTKQQWMVSARRAEAVVDFLRGRLAGGSDWPIYCWGAGAGGDWASKSGPVSKETQILIAVLSVND